LKNSYFLGTFNRINLKAKILYTLEEAECKTRYSTGCFMLWNVASHPKRRKFCSVWERSGFGGEKLDL